MLSVRYFGTVRPHRQVDLAFRVSGYVQALLSVRDETGETRPVQAGDTVTAGTVLARLQSADYRAQSDAAGAAVRTARAQAAQAAGRVSQARAARRQSVESVSEARAALQAAQAQYTQAVSSVGQYEAGVSEAQANVTQARSNWERTDDLYHSRSATKPQDEDARANLDTATAKLLAVRQARAVARGRVAEANAQINVCKARIRQAQAGTAASAAAVSEASAAVQAAQAQAAQAEALRAAQRVPVAETVLRAPLTGVVLARRVEIGSLVGPGSAAYSIADTARLNIVFAIPEQEAGHLRLGQRVSLTVGAQGDVPLIGIVTEIAPTANEKTRVFDVQVTIPNPHRAAKVGMTAALEIAQGVRESTTLVAPISAISQSRDQPSGASVMVITQEGGRLTARRRDVELGPSDGDKIVVRGVRRGTRIVASAPGLLYDGEPVRIVPSDAGGG